MEEKRKERGRQLKNRTLEENMMLKRKRKEKYRKKGQGNIDPKRRERGKDIMRKIHDAHQSERAENVEFRIQARVNVVDMANLALGLEKAGENNALRSLTSLTQRAFELAIRALMDHEEEITESEEALQVLEEMRIIDTKSTSLTGGALKRNRIRESLRNYRQEGGTLHARPPHRTITQEEIDTYDPATYHPGPMTLDPALQAVAAQELLRMKAQSVPTAHRESSPTEKTVDPELEALKKRTIEQILARQATMKMEDFPGLLPDPTKTAPDVDETLSYEEKLERLKERGA